ncbi:PIG-L family deacetylase [Aestuariibacter halophilus]|uniref:PIG-L family deacetylase n=1 Tax=Fluctibacter halophilus TaxID=226011 RepID=A0ABS8G3G1_9ALTE|nr:PIG-L deacetylase family protein [Aestuariibacter halophilus]MCC2615127.1 PIG-L family deacetylase [Aestuariibacter halophilus]
MKNVLVVAPHPDDESIGCGGTLLRLAQAGARLHWLIVTDMASSEQYPREAVARRQQEIEQVAGYYGFEQVEQLSYAPAQLDQYPEGDLVADIARIVSDIKPDTVFFPHGGDVHGDHRRVHQAVVSATKQFRHPYIRQLLAYETLSETDFGVSREGAFWPNLFIDVSDFMTQKQRVLATYASEIQPFPFPRSEQAVDAQGRLRGVQANVAYAEAFMLLKGVIIE